MAVYMKSNTIPCALPFKRILADDGSVVRFYGEHSFGSYCTGRAIHKREMAMASWGFIGV
jgi:hypothetical protein